MGNRYGLDIFSFSKLQPLFTAGFTRGFDTGFTEDSTGGFDTGFTGGTPLLDS